MPELPEVITVAAQLNKEIAGYTIENIWWDTPRMLLPTPDIFTQNVLGQTLDSVKNKGKLIVFGFENTQDALVGHLKLTGRFFIRKPLQERDPYVHVVMKLFNNTDQKELHFSCSRKFGYLEFVPVSELSKKLQSLGPVFLEEMQLDSFNAALSSTSRKIKDVLLDQSVMAGVGNIYANDALWLAFIHPSRPSKDLTPEQTKRLFEALELVLREGIQYGGASDMWFRNVYGGKGGYQERFKVYGRTGKLCLRCGTPIEYIKISGRGTFFCPRCQES